MEYWNETNFESLKAIGSAMATDANFSEFGQYCLSREKGLRDLAKTHLNAFLNHLAGLDRQTQWNIAAQLTELKYSKPRIHQLIPHPLEQALIQIFKEWLASSPRSPEPMRWLGFLTHDLDLWLQALALAPDDQISLVLTINRYMSAVDHNTHHLFESSLIGSIEDSLKLIEKAKALWPRLSNDAEKEEFSKEIQYFEDMLSDWRAFKAQSIETSFPKWCQRLGHEYSFSTVVYYEK